jgi:hypothetical protein
MTMIETPQQYQTRLFGLVADRDPLAVLAATPGRLRELVSGKPADALARKPAPDRWSVVEIVAHLADAEIVGAFRFRAVLGQPGTDLLAYDQDRWAEACRYQDSDIETSLDTFRALRGATLSLLRRISPGQLEHFGIHSERGRESVWDMIRLYAGHDLNHLGQIERLVS